MGTEPGQYRATRVLVWSIMKVRDPERAYEVHLMSNLKGIPRDGWKTGFTNYRYLIPWLTGGKGRAIFNDVDQIYLSDPAKLFDTEMDGKGVMAISERENAVMLIDCEVMSKLWTREDIVAGKKHDHFKDAVLDNGLFAPVPESWNSRDGKVPLNQTDCLHYTTLQTQPWKPFPSVLRYAESALAKTWHDLEREADEAGYLLFTRESTCNETAEMLSQRGEMLKRRTGVLGAAKSKLGKRIAWLVKKHGAKTILDYGSGEAAGYKLPQGADQAGPLRSTPEWPGASVRCYDPCVPAFAELDDATHDGVISVSMLDHLEPFDVPWAIEEMFARAKRFVFVGVSSNPSGDVLPNGRNANTTQQPPYWWHTLMALAARRHPNVEWLLVCETGGKDGKSRETFDASSPSPLK